MLLNILKTKVTMTWFSKYCTSLTPFDPWIKWSFFITWDQWREHYKGFGSKSSWTTVLWKVNNILNGMLGWNRANTKEGNPYHHSCYARNVPYFMLVRVHEMLSKTIWYVMHTTGIPRAVSAVFWSPAKHAIGKTALIGDWFSTKYSPFLLIFTTGIWPDFFWADFIETKLKCKSIGWCLYCITIQ